MKSISWSCSNCSTRQSPWETIVMMRSLLLEWPSDPPDSQCRRNGSLGLYLAFPHGELCILVLELEFCNLWLNYTSLICFPRYLILKKKEKKKQRKCNCPLDLRQIKDQNKKILGQRRLNKHFKHCGGTGTELGALAELEHDDSPQQSYKMAVEYFPNTYREIKTWKC